MLFAGSGKSCVERARTLQETSDLACRVTAAKLHVQLPQEPGTYYVVFSNRFSWITNKAVVADVKLQFNQRG